MPWPRGKYGDSYGGWGNTFEEACENERKVFGEPKPWVPPTKSEMREILKPGPLRPRVDGVLTKAEEKRKAIIERRRARQSARTP